MRQIIFLMLGVMTFSLAGCEKDKPSPSHETCFPQATRQENAAKFSDPAEKERFLAGCHMSDPPDVSKYIEPDHGY